MKATKYTYTTQLRKTRWTTNRSLFERGLIIREDFENSPPQENLELTVTPGRVRRQDEQVGVASSSTPARGGEEEANNNIGDSGRQPRPRQEGPTEEQLLGRESGYDKGSPSCPDEGGQAPGGGSGAKEGES